MALSKDPAVRQKQMENLKPITSSDHARELQLKGAAKRAERRKALEELKISAQQMEEVGAKVILQGMLENALASGDNEAAFKMASTLLEYEAPKLQRQEVNQVTKVKELTDEELEEELAKLKND